MAKRGIPVVLVENGTPGMLSARGMPITLVGGGGNAAVVSNGNTVALTGPDGSRPFGDGTAIVSNGAVQRVTLPGTATVITNQAAGVPVQDADGTSVGCTATIVPQTGQLSYVGVPGTAALVTNGMTVKMASFGGAGPVDGIVNISGGFINWVSLASQTSVIVSSGFTVDLGAISVSGIEDFATINVASGSITSVGVALQPTKTIVSNGAALTVPVTGTYTTTATLTVAGGVVTGIVLS